MRERLFTSAYMRRFGLAFILLCGAGLRAHSEQEKVEIDAGLTRYTAQAVSLPKDVQYLTPEGEIKIVGYNDMSGMLSKLDDLFTASHPDSGSSLNSREHGPLRLHSRLEFLLSHRWELSFLTPILPFTGQL